MVWKKVPKTKPGRGSWDPKKKLELIQTYILTGNLKQSAAMNNVPEVTARQWKAQVWWKEQEDELRRGSKLELSAKLSDLVAKAMSQLSDRIQHGDFVEEKTWVEPKKEGEKGRWVVGWKRKPISAEHANKITTQLIDRTLAVEKVATPEKITDDGLAVRLLRIQDDIKLLANRNKALPMKEVIDVQFQEYPSQPNSVVQAEGKPDQEGDHTGSNADCPQPDASAVSPSGPTDLQRSPTDESSQQGSH